MFSERSNKVRGHDYVTGKYRGSAHGDYNINLKLTKKISVIHSLRGYDSHLIKQEIGTSDLKVGVIPDNKNKKIKVDVYR